MTPKPSATNCPKACIARVYGGIGESIGGVWESLLLLRQVTSTVCRFLLDRNEESSAGKTESGILQKN